MRNTVKKAFVDTVPVLTGYVVLGFGFGILVSASSFSVWLAIAMSVFVYAGSMQYAAIGLLTGGASFLTVAVTTLMVNARHLFYGISMLERYKSTKAKPYLIFSITDETYSLVCRELSDVPCEERNRYYVLVSVFNHSYWVIGTAIGAIFGSLIPFNSQGIEFALTALFLTVFLEQWLTGKDHRGAMIGVGASVVCLLLFGSEKFLIPAMLVIACFLCILKDKEAEEDDG